MQAHIELSGLGVLPEMTLEKTQLERLKHAHLPFGSDLPHS